MENAYYHSLLLATKKNLRTIAFPNISTGLYQFPKERAAEIAVATVEKFLESAKVIEKIFFVCFDDDNCNFYKDKLSG